jgi:hypothetical protein
MKLRDNLTAKKGAVKAGRTLRRRRTQGRAEQGDAARETLRDTVWAHIETQADAGQGEAARESLRDTMWAHIVRSSFL